MSNLPSVPNNRHIFMHAAALIEERLSRLRNECVRLDDYMYDETGAVIPTATPNPQNLERTFLDVFELTHIHARLLTEAKRDD